MRNKHALFICENNEEAKDLSEIAQALNGYETTFIDIRGFYGHGNSLLVGYDYTINIKKPFNGYYSSWSKYKKILAIFYIYSICIRLLLKNNTSIMYSGIPIINARLLKFTFKKIQYFSYIRSVFQARDRQKSFIWKVFSHLGLNELLPFKADHYFVTGNASKFMLMGLGVNEDAITISGSISLNHFSKVELDPELTSKYTGVLYLSGAHNWHGDIKMEQFQNKLVGRLKEAASKNDIDFVIRPHPRDPENDGYRKIASIDELNASESLCYYSNNGKWLVVSNFSMMGFEFEFLGVNSIFIAPESAKIFFQDWFESTCSEAYTDINVIEKILNDSSFICPNGNDVYSDINNPIEVISRSV
jgi:hypothetical protein